MSLRWELDPIGQLGKYREARARQHQTAAKVREGLMAIDLDIRKAYEDLREARLRLATGKKGEKAVKTWLTATTQQLAAGLGKPKDLTDVLPKFFEIKLNVHKAMHDVNVGWAKLARAIGRAARERRRLHEASRTTP